MTFPLTISTFISQKSCLKSWISSTGYSTYTLTRCLTALSLNLAVRETPFWQFGIQSISVGISIDNNRSRQREDCVTDTAKIPTSAVVGQLGECFCRYIIYTAPLSGEGNWPKMQAERIELAQGCSGCAIALTTKCLHWITPVFISYSQEDIENSLTFILEF